MRPALDRTESFTDEALLQFLLSNLIFVPTRVSYSLTLPCSTEGLVRGGGDQVSMFKGRGDGFGCHQATNMSHVSKQVGIDVGAQLEEKEAG